MADPGLADEPVASKMPRKPRWRAWLRAIHRDVGYLSIGFTIIYAVSGIAQNHIEEWGDVSYTAAERQLTIAPIAPSVPDAVAIKQVVDAVQLGTPTDTFRAGDEIRLTYGNGVKVTALDTTVTIQERSRRVFIGVANWLHTARGKPVWRYISDVYAILLVYLAISGLFMIKGRLGLKWRGLLLVSAGVAVPVLYIALSGGPGAPESDDKVAGAPIPPSSMPVLKPVPTDEPVLKPLPPDDDSGGSAVLKPLPPDDN